MTCPHKKEDADIIAYHEKKMAEKHSVMEHSLHAWHGELADIHQFIIDQNEIIFIRRTGRDSWEATIRKSQV